ncbi:hypothetical protein MTO96_029660 [Rhipicephalus appendiculatus]
MITHACVRYEDDRRCAVVKIGDVKGFKADDDFKTTFYSVKWTDTDGETCYYHSRILLVVECYKQLLEKKGLETEMMPGAIKTDESLHRGKAE